MERQQTNVSRKTPGKSDFSRLFSQLLDGQRWRQDASDRDKAENCNIAFVRALTVCGAKQISERTVRNWKNGVAVPYATMMTIVHETACRGLAEDDPRIAQFRGVCRVAADLRGQGTAQRGAAHVEPGQAALVARARRAVPHPKLVDVALHIPNQAGLPEDFYLVATLNFGTKPVGYRKVVAEIGVTTANLLYEAKGCQPSPGSRFSELRPREGVEVAGSQWVFRAAGGVLRGSPLGGEMLARMIREGDATPTVKITVNCTRDTDLHVQLDPGLPKMSAIKTKILKRFVQKCMRDQDGSIELGWASLAWEAP